MQSLSIDIVSDVVCPWCFVGKHRLARALELLRGDHPDLAVTVRWLPFFLNPHTPPAGEPYRAFLEKKFGGPAQVDALQDRLREVGRSVGIDFAFEKIALRANTLRAHRLIYWAQQQPSGSGDVDALVERLFEAHFLNGEPVGDIAVLQRIAGECGYSSATVASYLAANADVDLVRAEERRGREIGVSSVPTFIFCGAEALSGAETAEILADAIRRHLHDAAAA